MTGNIHSDQQKTAGLHDCNPAVFEILAERQGFEIYLYLFEIIYFTRMLKKPYPEKYPEKLFPIFLFFIIQVFRDGQQRLGFSHIEVIDE